MLGAAEAERDRHVGVRAGLQRGGRDGERADAERGLGRGRAASSSSEREKKSSSSRAQDRLAAGRWRAASASSASLTSASGVSSPTCDLQARRRGHQPSSVRRLAAALVLVVRRRRTPGRERRSRPAKSRKSSVDALLRRVAEHEDRARPSATFASAWSSDAPPADSRITSWPVGRRPRSPRRRRSRWRPRAARAARRSRRRRRSRRSR